MIIKLATLKIRKKSSVMLYIILIGFVAAVATLFGTTVTNFRPDINFIGESALSIYENENEVYAQQLFIQSAAYYSLHSAVNNLPNNLVKDKCGRYGLYPIWFSGDVRCIPSKKEIDQALKEEFYNSFKPKLEKNSDLNINAENYEYSIINEGNLKFLGIATNTANYDLTIPSQITADSYPIESYRKSLPIVGNNGKNLQKFSCVARDKPVCELREGALSHLAKASEEAKNQGYVILVNDAYRSYDEQKELCGKIVDSKCSNRNAAPPGRSSHQTGGAVDVRLVIEGNRYSCGTIDIRDKPRIDDYSNNKDPNGLKINECRQKLKEIMTNAGFVNLQLEWWHWEYGTDMWAREMSKQQLAQVKPLYVAIG